MSLDQMSVLSFAVLKSLPNYISISADDIERSILKLDSNKTNYSLLVTNTLAYREYKRHVKNFNKLCLRMTCLNIAE